MAKIAKITLLIILTALVGCQTQFIRPQRVLIEQEINQYFKGLIGYEVDQVQMDYAAVCKIRIKTSEETVSGSCNITVSHDRQFRMMLYSPLGGLEMAVYMDDELIQLLLKSEKVFYQFVNNERNRRKRLQFVDLDVAELQEVLWGRKINSNDTRLKFQYNDKKPVQINTAGKSQEVTIQYASWLNYRGVQFPRIININDSQRHISIKLVITELNFGFWEDLDIKQVPLDYERKS